MTPKKKSDHYTEQELKEIKAQWIKDKTRIDADPKFGYYFDRDKEYERHLHNKNLQAMFRHAARIRRQLFEGEPVHLYPSEPRMVSKVYEKVVKDGYYSESKSEEKKTRAWLGKIISRQTYRKLKKPGS